jgi:hypothetical protein
VAFEYGESYYGLRTFGSSAGEVKDASATVTVTSSMPNVPWAIAVGSGQITGTVASSSSCSGEVVIIEETDVFSYGSGLYGQNEYTQGDLQTVATATSSATVVGLRIQSGSATVTVASSISASGRRVPEGSALINGSSTTTVTSTGNGSRVRESSATSSPATTITASAFITAKGAATASAVASLTASGVFMVNGAASTTATVTSAAICNRVRFGSGVPTAVASITVLGFATRGGIASCTPSASLVADSEKIWQGHAVTQPESGATATCNRVQNTSGVVSATSGTATIGREKWEIITNDSVTWTEIAA